jgi:hypothetical protein
LLKLDKDKYYLTKLNRQMKYEEMTNDLFFRDAAVNSDIDIGEKSKVPFYILVCLSIFTSISVMGFVIIKK